MGQTDKKQTNEQTELHITSLSSLNLTGLSVFQLESRQTDKKQTNGQNYTNFKWNLGYDDDLSPCQV